MNGGRGIEKGCLLVFFVKEARTAIVNVLTVLETQNLEPDKTIWSFTKYKEVCVDGGDVTRLPHSHDEYPPPLPREMVIQKTVAYRLNLFRTPSSLSSSAMRMVDGDESTR
jgi:hypothetical protein